MVAGAALLGLIVGVGGTLVILRDDGPTAAQLDACARLSDPFPDPRFVDGIDLIAFIDADAGRDVHDATLRLAEAHPDALFVECGPGNVLTGLMKRIAPNVQTATCGTADEVDALLARVAA